MRRFLRSFALAFASGLAVAAAGGASACSVASDYRVPTNIELVEQSELIVLGSIEGAEGDQTGGNPYDARLLLKPVRAIKGELPQAQLKLLGFLGFRGRPGAIIPTPLNSPHPSAMWGACIRQAYVKDGLVVAMFRSTPEGFVQIKAPFARAVEDVEGPDALWVRTAMLYSRLLEAPPGTERRAALEAERRRLEGEPGEDAQAIAADIAHHLELVPEG